MTQYCLTTNPKHPGGVFGYVDSGDWPGGQSEYNMVPYADFNCLKIPDFDEGMKKIFDIALLSDVLPTAYHAAYEANVGTGSTVYIAGAGPVGLACASCCFLLGTKSQISTKCNLDLKCGLI